MKEECHPQQMLRELSIAAAISTFLPLSQGDRRGADLGGPESLPAVLADMTRLQCKIGTHMDTHSKLSLLRERAGINYRTLFPRTHSCTSDDRCSPTQLHTGFRPLSKVILSLQLGTLQLTDWMENNGG